MTDTKPRWLERQQELRASSLMFRDVLDKGHVALLETMGSDTTIAQSARASTHWKTKSEDAQLIDFLVRHMHTSPLEMGVLRLHVRAPIAVVRQWMRHRMASYSEISGRYDVIENSFYTPDEWRGQSESNRQASEGIIEDEPLNFLQLATHLWKEKAFTTKHIGVEKTTWRSKVGLNGAPVLDVEYGSPGELAGHLRTLDTIEINKVIHALGQDPWDFIDQTGIGMYDTQNNDAFQEYELLLKQGVSREQARLVLPLATYTEFVWKVDVHNLMHFLRLRLAPDAQKEIRLYAEAVFEMLKLRFPACAKAFENHILNRIQFSQDELAVLRVAFEQAGINIEGLVEAAGSHLRKTRKRELAAKLHKLLTTPPVDE